MRKIICIFIFLLVSIPCFAFELNKRTITGAGPIKQCIEQYDMADPDNQTILLKYTTSSTPLNMLRRHAKDGDPISECILGLTYLEMADNAQALEWLESAHSHGNTPAAYYLYHIYKEGSISGKDTVRAMRYLEQTARSSDPEMVCRLAYEYTTGELAGQDFTKARSIYDVHRDECPADEVRYYDRVTSKSVLITKLSLRLILPTVLLVIIFVALWAYLMFKTKKLRH